MSPRLGDWTEWKIGRFVQLFWVPVVVAALSIGTAILGTAVEWDWLRLTGLFSLFVTFVISTQLGFLRTQTISPDRQTPWMQATLWIVLVVSTVGLVLAVWLPWVGLGVFAVAAILSLGIGLRNSTPRPTGLNLGYAADESILRFFRVFWGPAALVAAGAVLSLRADADRWTYPWFRLGIIMMLGGVLWYVAKGFALATLRATTIFTLLVIAALLIQVGNSTRDLTEAERFESTRRELAIELGLLGAPTAAVVAEVAPTTTEVVVESDDPVGVTTTVEPVSFDGVDTEVQRLLLVAVDSQDAATSAQQRADDARRNSAEARSAAEDAADESERQLEETRILLAKYDGPFVSVVRLWLNDEPDDRDEQRRNDAAAGRDNVAVAWRSVGDANVAAETARLASEAASAARRAAAVAAQQGIAAVSELRNLGAGPDIITRADEASEATCAAAWGALRAAEGRAGDTAEGNGRDEADITKICQGIAEPSADEGDTDLTSAAANARGAGASVASAQENAQMATEALERFDLGPCGGLADDVESVIDFDEAVRCGEQLVSSCRDSNTGSGDCQPRQARRLLLQSYLAELRSVAVAAAADDRPALETQIDSVRNRIEQLSTPVPVIETITDGADDVITKAIDPLANRDVPTGLASLGWVMLAIALIVGYRLLETANDRRRPGPATVAVGEDATPESKVAAESFRVYLGSVDLSEPSPVPGGSAVTSASKFFQGDDIQNQAVKFIASLFQTTAFPKRGVEVEVSARNIEDPKATAGDASAAGADGTPTKRLEMTLRGLTARTRTLLFAQQFRGADEKQVIGDSAYYAAAHVLDTGYTTPDWLRWRAGRGRGLRAYQRVALDGASPTPQLTNDQRRALLEEAVAANPSTGVALVALANQRSIDGDLVQAAQLLKLTRDRNPRFFTAQYRFGVTLSMIAANMEEYWNHAEQRDELREMLKELAPWGFSGSDQELLLRLAIDELGQASRRLALWRTVLAAIRQRERTYWLRIASSQRRTALREATRSARYLALLRLEALDAKPPPDPRARGKRTIWQFVEENVVQKPLRDTHGRLTMHARDRIEKSLRRVNYDDGIVRYNAACLLAAGQDYSAAGEHLMMSRLARGGSAISRRWALTDPDLRTFRTTYYWTSVDARLREMDGWLERPREQETS